MCHCQQQQQQQPPVIFECHARHQDLRVSATGPTRQAALSAALAKLKALATIAGQINTVTRAHTLH